MYLPRSAEKSVRRLQRVFPVVCVTGARQVGKSTLLSRLFGTKAEHIVFDPLVDVGRARAEPELFLENHDPPLILDEIQYAPELVPSLKRWVDRSQKRGRYFVTGSQQWSVMKTLAESLTGRVGFVDLDGFSLREIDGDLSGKSWLELWLESPGALWRRRKEIRRKKIKVYPHIWKGSLPRAHLSPMAAIPDFWKAYERTYLERDVRLIADVSDLALFLRFLRLTAALTAQEMNFSELGREIGVAPQTSQRWLAVLSNTFQWFELPAYSRNSVKRVSGRPKGHMSDTGLVCHALAISSPKALESHPAWGAVFESAVVGELRRLLNAMAMPARCYHWRSHGGAEVDVVLERDGVLYPIEIKGKRSITRRDALGLAAFRECFSGDRVADGLILAPVEEMSQLTENDYVFPWDL